MSEASVHVPFFRALWAGRFVDTCTITDTTDRGTFNPATGAYDLPTTATVYSGACLVRPVNVEQVDAGEATRTFHDVTLYLPDTVTGVKVEQQVTFDTSLDPLLQGLSGRVTDVDFDTYRTHVEATVRVPLGQGTL